MCVPGPLEDWQGDSVSATEQMKETKLEVRSGRGRGTSVTWDFIGHCKLRTEEKQPLLHAKTKTQRGFKVAVLGRNVSPYTEPLQRQAHRRHWRISGWPRTIVSPQNRLIQVQVHPSMRNPPNTEDSYCTLAKMEPPLFPLLLCSVLLLLE